jgi:hypothetical protein
VTSAFAEIVLAVSIPLMVGIFFVMRPVPAALVVALGSELFLPVGPGIKLPFAPNFDKHTLPYLCILIACLLRCPGRVTKLPKEKWFLGLALLSIVGGVLTSLTNRDSLLFGSEGQVFIAGLDLKDGFYMGISHFIRTFLPFYLGYALFRKGENFKQLVAGLAIAALVYIPFALVELRMSPQWHRWIYGYAQHDFLQTLRWGGYRPMVFMSHGLAVGQFFVASTFFLVILARFRRRLLGLPIRLLAWTQLVVLIACKSTGAIVYAIAGVPLLLLAKPKYQLLVAIILAWITLLYPLLRLSGAFPVADLIDAARTVQTERADSLAFRFRNEDDLLARTRERIFFGWGEYGRNMVRDEEGRSLSTFDGYWIIRLSANGLIGFITSFAPLLIPVFLTRRRLALLADEKSEWVVAGAAVTLTILTVDLIPNGLWACYPYLIAGALMRQLREAAKKAKETTEERESPREVAGGEGLTNPIPVSTDLWSRSPAAQIDPGPAHTHGDGNA